MINKDSDAAYQSAVNTALENARKASKAADAAWDAYDTTLDILNRENWEAARDAYDVAYDAADAAWENARNVVNGK